MFQCIANSALQAKMNIHLFGAAQTAMDISRATSVEFEMHINILKHSLEANAFYLLSDIKTTYFDVCN